MRHASPPRDSGLRASELAILVETEAQLERAISEARDTARGLREAARQRAEAATSELDGELAAQAARIKATTEAEAEAQIARVHEDARVRIAHYQALAGPALASLARALAERLVELAGEKEAP